jgi:hypothetical protein
MIAIPSRLKGQADGNPKEMGAKHKAFTVGAGANGRLTSPKTICVACREIVKQRRLHGEPRQESRFLRLA